MAYDISSSLGWAPGGIRRMGGAKVETPLPFTPSIIPATTAPLPPAPAPGLIPVPGKSPYPPGFLDQDIRPPPPPAPLPTPPVFEGPPVKGPTLPLAPVTPPPAPPLTRRLPGTKWRGEASETGYMVSDPEFVAKFGEDVYAPESFIWSPKPEKPVPESKELWDWDMIPGYEGRRDRYDWMKPSGEFEYTAGAPRLPSYASTGIPGFAIPGLGTLPPSSLPPGMKLPPGVTFPGGSWTTPGGTGIGMPTGPAPPGGVVAW